MGTIKDGVIEILADQLGVSSEKINNDSKLADDLGTDSLDTVEIVHVLEDRFAIDIPDKDIVDIKSVADIVGYIEANTKAGGRTYAK
ncbi:MAG: acyl carrier protein [Candidatus Omnitrophica bacterium]|nr:acyl carrier protein [Candidatus Omnitrophota bacterium]MBU1852360.1 acyl carrier protein [Candidatus Omnitrophota bacterium]